MYVNSAADRMRAWLTKPVPDDFDSENSCGETEPTSFLGTKEEQHRFKLHDLCVEIDNLKELLHRAKEAKLREVRASAVFREELGDADKKIADLESLNFKLAKELSGKTATVKKLEQHITRLEEQLAERDTKHAKMVTSETSLMALIKQQAAEAVNYAKRAEEDAGLLKDANIKLKDLENQVRALRESFKLNLGALNTHCYLSQRSDSTATELKADLKCEASDVDYFLEVGAGEPSSKKDSLLGVTDSLLPFYGLMPDDSANSCDSFEDFPTERSCEADLKAKISELEGKLVSVEAQWSSENRILKEYVDELRQLLSNLLKPQPKGTFETIQRRLAKRWLDFNYPSASLKITSAFVTV